MGVRVAAAKIWPRCCRIEIRLRIKGFHKMTEIDAIYDLAVLYQCHGRVSYRPPESHALRPGELHACGDAP